MVAAIISNFLASSINSELLPLTLSEIRTFRSPEAAWTMAPSICLSGRVSRQASPAATALATRSEMMQVSQSGAPWGAKSSTRVESLKKFTGFLAVKTSISSPSILKDRMPSVLPP